MGFIVIIGILGNILSIILCNTRLSKRLPRLERRPIATPPIVDPSVLSILVDSTPSSVYTDLLNTRPCTIKILHEKMPRVPRTSILDTL
jgi:hypothetical protein